MCSLPLQQPEWLGIVSYASTHHVRHDWIRAQALTYSLALLRHWNGLPSNYVALIDVDEYIVIDQPKAPSPQRPLGVPVAPVICSFNVWDLDARPRHAPVSPVDSLRRRLVCKGLI